MTTAIEKVNGKGYALMFTPDQEAMIRNSFLNGASPQEAAVLLEVARLRGLNPVTRQIHFVKRYDREKGAEVWAHQVSIDGLRAIAERTGKYDGQDEAEYEMDPKGGLVSAKVKVYRKDIGRPFVGVAYWKEYAQTKRDGSLTSMWAKFPRLMLAKCAEALAMRKAFPEDMSGLYTDDEMAQADTAATAREQRATQQVDRLVSQQQARALPAQQPRPTIEAAPAVVVTVEPLPADAVTGEVVQSFAFRRLADAFASAPTRQHVNGIGGDVKRAMDAGELTAEEVEQLRAIKADRLAALTTQGAA